MDNKKKTLDYKETWFITPQYIADLPGLTLNHLKFYATIFQFWNKNLTCYLSNEALKERTGIKGIATIMDCFAFFESHNEMRREQRGNRRYIIRPEKLVEIECAEITQGIEMPIGGYRDADTQGIEMPIPSYTKYEVKKLNKELEVIQVQKTITQTELSISCLVNKKCLDEFNSKFKNMDVTIEDLLDDCVWYYALLEKPQLVSPQRFLKWIKREEIKLYVKKEKNLSIKVFRDLTEEQRTLIQDYTDRVKKPELYANSKPMSDNKQREAKSIIEMLSQARTINHV